MYKQSKNLFKAGGFNLRKFVTNARHLQEKFDQEEGVANTTQSITGSDETYTSSTLGTTQISIVGEQKVLGKYKIWKIHKKERCTTYRIMPL